MKLRFFFILFLFTSKLTLQSQSYFHQQIDSSDIIIGDQITLTQRSSSIPKPDPLQKLQELKWLEIIKPGDWILSPKQYYERQITFSVFDSGFYQIPILQVKLDSNLIETPPIDITVHLPIDTAQTLLPIKDIIATPLTSYILYYIIAGVIFLILILILFYHLFKADRRVPHSIEFRKIDLPHVIALKCLDELEQRKLWQSGNVKEYYDELLHILRSYIKNGFHINALELTSRELAQQLLESQHNWNMLDELYSCLHFSDLVKFANKTSNLDDHLHWMSFARYFVIQNKDLSLEIIHQNKKDFQSVLNSDIARQFEDSSQLVPDKLLELLHNKNLVDITLIRSLTQTINFKLPEEWVKLHESKLGQLALWQINILSNNKGLYGKLLYIVLIPLIAFFLPVLYIVGLWKGENIFSRGVFVLSKDNKLMIDFNRFKE